MTKSVSLGQAERARALTQMPILEGCPPPEVEQIASRAHVLLFEDGEVIVPEGEEGLGFYFITDGRVRVLRVGREIAELGAGDFFGEVSLLEGTVRNATVVADGTVVCIGILRSFFRPLLARNPRLALRILDMEIQRFAEDEDADRAG
ncbi:MAG: cyclic nucleotide-binding domain-containing protein [Actinobacteria bacterium]|nr:MAG: cyclic nucleotide-binding domain-containing protein [Actinomycetota bacterium]